MKNQKMKTMILSLGLVGLVGTGATLAYFSATSDTVTNTFKVGDGISKLYIDEVDTANAYPHKPIVGNDRVTTNTYEGILPGELITKDPTVHIESDVNAYVFVAVTNNGGVNADGHKNLTINMTNEWKQVASKGNTDYYLFVGTGTLQEPETVKNDSLEVFPNVSVNTDLDTVTVNDKTIEVLAAAIQADENSLETAQAEALNLLGYNK